MKRRGRLTDTYLGEMYPVKYVKDCRRKLERVADLTQYTTPIAMDDLDQVRAWLGYEKINLFGVSYGTRAVVYMRQHPTHVRSAVLMGTSPTYAKVPLYHARNGQRAMQLLLDECAADTMCGRAYPRLKRELVELLARLSRHPAHVRFTPSAKSKEIEVEIEIRGSIFAEELRSLMYSLRISRHIPFIIHEATQGNFDPFLTLAVPEDPSSSLSSLIADGMYLSVTCAEDVSLIDPKEAERINKGTFFGNYRVFEQRRACQYWPLAKLPAGYDKAEGSEIPVLLVSGHMDPITPPEWAAEVASHFPNSRHFVIRNQAHVPVGLAHLECLGKVILGFLEEASVMNLETSCLDQISSLPFFVEAQRDK